MKAKDDVIFKGTKSGVLMILNESADYVTLKRRIAERLAEADKFFYPGAPVTVDVGSRVLTSAQLIELEEILRAPHGLTLLNVVHSPEDLSAAEAVAATSEPARWADAHSAAWGESVPDERAGAIRAEAAHRETTGPLSRGDERNWLDEEVAPGDTVLVKRTLRSGQRVRFNGNVVVLGDVNPGAEVVASGDIVVMGVLRGVAHAGATGNTSAIVAAFRLQPTQLRIAHLISRAPDGADAVAPAGPEMAQIRDGAVVIDHYPPHPGSLV